MVYPHGSDHRDFQLQFDKVVFVPVVQIVRCAAMSCGGESFSPASAHVYACVNVKLMKGKYTILHPLTLGVFARSMTGFAALTLFAPTTNYFQFQLKGKRRSGVATQVVDVPVVQLHRCCSCMTGWLFWAVYTGTRPGFPHH